MTLAGHFSSKYVDQSAFNKCKFNISRNKVTGAEIKTSEDFPSARIRHADGSHQRYQHGKPMAGTYEEAPSKKKATKDVPAGEGMFYKPTEVSTIVQKTKGDGEKAGETDAASRVRKKIDVNARAYKL